MGGLAFASGPNPVFTPRMPPDVYRAVRDRCQEKLRELFVVVATPIEGPAKTSFGDTRHNQGKLLTQHTKVDLFVAWSRQHVFPTLKTAPSSHSSESPKEVISRALGAIRCKSDNPYKLTIAIPWPEDFPFCDIEPKPVLIPEIRNNGEVGRNSDEDAKSTNDPRPMGIQVDLHICETLDYLQWMLFKHAHGDLWNLLGSTIRPFGLTIDEVGLYIRIPEIEEVNKKEAKVLLSTDPGEILCFLGLKSDEKQWEDPFASDEDVYEYATTCRLFWVKPKETEVGADGGDTSNLGAGGGEDSGTVMMDKRKLKSNDRRRMTYRPLFRKWIEEFLPKCRVSGRFPSTPFTRDEVRQQIFEYFPGVQSIYDSRLTEWCIKRQSETLWKEVIKPAVPVDMDPDRRSCCVSALRKIIMQGGEGFDGIVAPSTLKGKDGLFDEDAVRAWVKDNWPKVSDIAWEINRQRFAEAVEHKAAKKRTVSGSEKPADEEGKI
ncbi:hypothetical protein GQX73_g134 [Xylaria multiplex]|uniref:Uncharacterized protein n=1 Tax=Xylaria multiplex TaxID=323545 RepID=A0A7C8J8F7_9PEZI|nr:hypothetical protein GQX73_g134 [Xylaria multiplex]